MDDGRAVGSTWPVAGGGSGGCGGRHVGRRRQDNAAAAANVARRVPHIHENLVPGTCSARAQTIPGAVAVALDIAAAAAAAAVAYAAAAAAAASVAAAARLPPHHDATDRRPATRQPHPHDSANP